ncbi:Sphingosine N-acyltransferase lag1 [Microbotryomycetes sp. JL221]|nr:Sphingosine N-acyltransferase lag1 [Microbotryomycetes sp. JL221]
MDADATGMRQRRRHEPKDRVKRVRRNSEAHRERATVLSWCMDRQLELSLAVLMVVAVGNLLEPRQTYLSTKWTPSPTLHRSFWSKFVLLSFKDPATESYYKGRDDAYFIAFWVVAFWFLREAMMRWAFQTIARFCGIRNHRSVVRFAEQGYAMSYATVSWLVGLYIMQTSPYRNLRTRQFWEGYPHEAMTPLTKTYLQTAFWMQQIIVLNLEERRKDFVQMFTHHVITTSLMAGSYIQNWTRIGNAILVTMDPVDIVLPLAKLFKYTGKARAADVCFAIFLVVWILTRHVVFGVILWSVYFEVSQVMPYTWKPQQGFFFNRTVHVSFAVLLTALQCILSSHRMENGRWRSIGGGREE